MRYITMICFILAGSLSGCANVKQRYNKYTHHDNYLQTARYQSVRISVPKDLNGDRISDYYPIPRLAEDARQSHPIVTPPGYQPKRKHHKKGKHHS